jgi:hypothetical protein
MKDIIVSCVICGKTLDPNRTHVDTCGERCYKRQLENLRAAFALAAPAVGAPIFYPTGCAGTVLSAPNEGGWFTASTRHPERPKMTLNTEHRGLTWDHDRFTE